MDWLPYIIIAAVILIYAFVIGAYRLAKKADEDAEREMPRLLGDWE